MSFTDFPQDGDDKLSFAEFQIMINPPEPPEVPKPRAAQHGLVPQGRLHIPLLVVTCYLIYKSSNLNPALKYKL